MRVGVLVIGGGVTGAGIARDLALRGHNVFLLESADFCNGASGGKHGVLHSGARYVVSDPVSARECSSESEVLKRIASNCIEDNGGLFVRLQDEDAAFQDKFEQACRAASVPAKHMARSELLEVEPQLSGMVEEGYEVKDASIDPFQLVLSNVASAREGNAILRNHCALRRFEVREGRIVRAEYLDRVKGGPNWVEPELVINAAGAWSDQVAALAGLSLPMSKDYGAMLVYNGRLVDRLVNRLRPSGDGDIIVPNHTAMIVGTTSRRIDDPDATRPTQAEIVALRRQAEQVVPGLRSCRIIRAYGGSRPLATAAAGRGASRSFRIIDHAEHGVDNMLSVIGGKLTTYRLMAEMAVDEAEAKLGRKAACRTANEELPVGMDISHLGIEDYLKRSLKRRYGGLPIGCLISSQEIALDRVSCSCEQVLRFELDHFAASEDVRDLSDLLRRTRAGMGFCQSGDCIGEMLDALAARGKCDPKMFDRYLSERERGILPVLSGDQLRQELFKAHMMPPFDWKEVGK